MKLFWMKNKALIAALCAVLVLGVAFWGGLRLFEGNQMQDAFVRTAYADAEATSTPVPGEMPVPTAVPTELPAEMISADILGLEWKLGSIPGSGRSSREGDDNPLQYSFLGNGMDRGA